MTTPYTGEELIGSEEEVNGYRFEKIIGRDIAGRLIFKSVNYKHQKRSVKIIPLIPIEVTDIAFDQAILLTDMQHPFLAQSYEFMVRRQNTQLLIFSEYCEQNLAKCFKQIPDNDLAKYAMKIIESLQYVHEVANSSHSDVRMQCIQLTGGRSRIPKLTFYCVDWEKEVPRDLYLTKELVKQYEEKRRINELFASKADDMWALGYLLLQLFSRKRINEIIGQPSRNGLELLRQISPINRAIYQQLKFTKIKQLLAKRLFHPSPEQRATISQFKQEFRAAIEAVDFSVTRPFKHPGMAKEEKANKISQKKKSEQKYEQIIQRTSRKTNADAFRLEEVKDRSKLKILNLSEMKITRIESVFGVSNLQWLYLEGNLIRKIENLDYPRLKGLNLGNNLIPRIEGLDRLTSLQQLYLQNNEISKIENLEQLRNLKWLYLNHNKIGVIQNLDQLKALKTIALRENMIDQFRQVNAEGLKELKKQGVEVYLQ